MKYPIPKLKLAAPLLAALLAAGAAHALDAPLTATHRIVAVQQKPGGHSSVTLEVTASNTGTGTLADVILRRLPGMPFDAALDAEPLILGSIAAGESAIVQWVVDVAGLVPAGTPALQRLMFAGEAADAGGETLTFPVHSLGETP